MNEVFERVLDAADASVGGGSAAALAGAMAAGLAGMVATLTPGHGCDMPDGRCREVAAEADELCRLLTRGAQDDADAYGAVATAYRMAREGEEATAASRAAIQRALEMAAEIPLENARRCLRVRTLCAELGGRSNPAAASDLSVGVLLADSGVHGCLINVGVNSEAMPDRHVARALEEDASAVRNNSETLVRSTKEEM